MICYRCGEEVAGERVCPVCNADLSIFEKIRHISNAFYNDGLQQATVRNMSGAIISLKASLRFDKTNIEARNLPESFGIMPAKYKQLADSVKNCQQDEDGRAVMRLREQLKYYG